MQHNNYTINTHTAPIFKSTVIKAAHTNPILRFKNLKERFKQQIVISVYYSMVEKQDSSTWDWLQGRKLQSYMLIQNLQAFLSSNVDDLHLASCETHCYSDALNASSALIDAVAGGCNTFVNPFVEDIRCWLRNI